MVKVQQNSAALSTTRRGKKRSREENENLDEPSTSSGDV